MSNPELDAAVATVPDIARTRQLHEDAKKRLREHPMGDVPDVARNNVVDDAVRTFQADGSWPADLGKRAAKAYTAALEWEAERLARVRAKDATELLAYDTRQALASDALEHLGTRLDAILSDARKAAETLGDVRSADAAIKCGGAVVAAWSKVQSLTEDLTNVRQAQWTLLDPAPRPRSIAGEGDTDERRKLREWKRQGYGEVRRRLDDVPAFVQDATRSGRYSEEVLLWLASVETAYVPTSFEDLRDDAEIGDLVDVSAHADGPIDDRYQPTVLPPLEPKPTRTYSHSRTPDIDFSQSAPERPQVNSATPGVERTTDDYFS
ncbi:hypothetical protein ACIQ6R_14105 [Streptomyces sp. NPDC096048]|uniref:hypothetical protein n=1 Tax=Streptomyces sp. NPDC096048 TaxID=3366072 RepID=UPI00382DB7DD